MNERLKTTLWVIGYSFLAGLLLAIFGVMAGFIRYIFSLLALYIGIRFFRKYDSIGLRITFIAVAIVFYFLVTIVYAMILYFREFPIT